MKKTVWIPNRKADQRTLHPATLGLCTHTVAIAASWWEKCEMWSELSKHKEQMKDSAHIQICNLLCRRLSVFDLKVFKWNWLWCKNIITRFCQTHRHMHRHAHRRPPCKQRDCAMSQHSINRLIYTTGTTCFRRSLFTQICCRAQLEAITLPQKSNVVGLAIPKCIF